jgi:hypothetical protein
MQQAQMQAAPAVEAKVKAEIGNWLLCEDAQGEYYVNKVTQQVSNEVPPELRAVQQAPQVQQVAQQAPQPQILRELPGGWLQCQDEQGVYFFNEVTQESCVDVPAALRQQQAAPKQPQPMVYTQPAQSAPAAAAGQPKVKEQIGDWMICEDAQGEYYINARTQQSFDQAPAELVQLYQMAQQKKQLAAQKAQAASQQAAMQQQIRLQQQQQQVLQQQMQYQPQAQYVSSVGSASQYYQQQQQQRQYR